LHAIVVKPKISSSVHEGVVGGHFVEDIIAKKILDVGY
jgi:hypothetical protein